MASTRSKNDTGNYALEQHHFHLARQHIHAPHRTSHRTALAELGINPSHLPREALAHNPVEIETKLFGIGSSNMVMPAPIVHPQLKRLETRPWFDRLPMVMPKRLITEPNQRPSLW